MRENIMNSTGTKEEEEEDSMETGSSSRGSSSRATAPKPASVWETRIKLDQIKGGIKILDHNPPTPPNDHNTQIRTKQSPSGRRKTWKSDTISEGGIQIARQRSESAKNLAKEIASCSDAKSQPSIVKNPSSSRSDEDEVCQEKRAVTTGVSQIIMAEQTVDLAVDREIVTKTRQKPDKKPSTRVVEEGAPQPTCRLPSTRPIDDFGRRTNTKLQSFVDLVMWRDVSRSAFIFGVGIFSIVSSSFTKDLNISFISVISYCGLLYLAANFLFRSLTDRGSMGMMNSDLHVVGEEEAIWLVKLLLPCVNEFVVKLRALFCGDPATTIKLAVLLFILAQCGSSITLWKMAKLGFIGVFTVPKICSSYSAHITAYVTFWVRRFNDAWKSCSHKKIVGFAIFTLIWNLSSIVARVWMVFMLLVALKYYQQSTIRSDDWTRKETLSSEGCRGQAGKCNGGQLAEFEKQKKVC